MYNCKNCGAPLSKTTCLYCGTEYSVRDLLYGKPTYTLRERARKGTTIDASILARDSIRGLMMQASMIEDIQCARIEDAHISCASIRNI